MPLPPNFAPKLYLILNFKAKWSLVHLTIATCRGQEITITYERTSHPFHIQTSLPIGVWLIHFPLLWWNLLGVFEANSGVKSTRRVTCEPHNTHYFQTCYVGWMRGTLVSDSSLSPLRSSVERPMAIEIQGTMLLVHVPSSQTKKHYDSWELNK